jgi:hypothetical protein
MSEVAPAILREPEKLVGVPSEKKPFYVRCPQCQVPIRILDRERNAKRTLCTSCFSVFDPETQRVLVKRNLRNTDPIDLDDLDEVKL